MGTAIRWSEDDLTAYRKRSAAQQPRVIEASVQDEVVNQVPHTGPRYKSKWEARFAQLLDAWKQDGSILWWGYESLTLLLPGGVRYRVDFAVLPAEGVTRCIEVKGRMMEPARIKLRQAIELHGRFEWYLVKGDMVPRRLYTPDDVPATTKSKR